jgi:Putative Actinobacterial Holin-X, holin superfamily III
VGPQFAKLVQNEVDLAKAEFGEKVSKIRGAIAFIGAAAIFLIPTLVMALFALSAAFDLGRMVAINVLPDRRDRSRRNRRSNVYDRR